MATIDIPVGTSAFTTTTYTASSGDVFNIPAGMVGNIVINGATDYTVNIIGDLTGRVTNNLNYLQFGEGSDVTVNIPAGVDTSPYQLVSHGDSLAVNIGDGATVGNIYAHDTAATGSFSVIAGDNVTVEGTVQNLGPADGTVSFGANASIAKSVHTSSGVSADVSFESGAFIGGNLYGATGTNPGQNSTITLGDDVTINGTLVSNHLYGDRTVVIGDNLTLKNALNLAGGTRVSGSEASANLTIGDNAFVNGNITGTEDDDVFVIGDNWNLANINLLLGNDNVTLGTQAFGAGLTQIDGGNPNGDGSSYGSDVDGITVALRPDQIAAFNAAGYIDNGDGTWSAPPRAFNGNPVIAPDLAVRDFEGPAEPIIQTLTITPAPDTPFDPLTGNPLTAENGAPAQIVITRSGPTTDPLVVTLTDGDPTETNAPTTVTIPAGESSIIVVIPSVDDTIVDGDQISTITATADGFEPATQDVTVADDDVPIITITPTGPIDPLTGNPLTAENGAPAQIVITRNTDTTDPLEVFLTDGDPSETNAPISVIIPAGQDSVVVDIPSVDDPLVDGPQISTITAEAPGFVPATQDVTVADDDVLQLTIEPGPTQPIDPVTGLPVTGEQGDPVEIVITRNGPTTDPLEVTLTDGDPTETRSPMTVEIPAGADSVTVLIFPVDDPLVDGDQTVPIIATAPDYAPATQDVIVEDDDVPTLTITPAPDTPFDPLTGNPVTAENGAPAQIVITRNTDTTDPLEVFLTDGDPSETNAPISVIIPAGEESVIVEIPSVDDPDVDGPQISTITAEAPGFVPATQDVTVRDDDALIEGRVFSDVDGDDTENGVAGQDPGLGNVALALVKPDGTVVATTTTEADGSYRFTAPAGQYQILAPLSFGGVSLVQQNIGNDAFDSDADPSTGLTDVFNLTTAGFADLDIGYQFVPANQPPQLQDDAATTCADDKKVVQVLANDTDPENDALEIVAINGQTIDPFFSPSVVTSNGTIVRLVTDFITGETSLLVDGETAYAGLDIFDTAVENITYTVSDSAGNLATATLEMTFKGDANSVESLFDALPTVGTYNVRYAGDEFDFLLNLAPDFAYDITINNTGDTRFDGVTFEKAYCLDFGSPVLRGIENDGNIFGAQGAAALSVLDQDATSFANGLAATENFDLVKWVVAQDFEGQGYSGWEVQFAIWELVDEFDSSIAAYDRLENTEYADVQEIVDQALALTGANDVGVDSFDFSVGDPVGVIIDPTFAKVNGNQQPFIVSVDWEDFDCLCPADDGGLFG